MSKKELPEFLQKSEVEIAQEKKKTAYVVDKALPGGIAGGSLVSAGVLGILFLGRSPASILAGVILIIAGLAMIARKKEKTTQAEQANGDVTHQPECGPGEQGLREDRCVDDATFIENEPQVNAEQVDGGEDAPIGDRLKAIDASIAEAKAQKAAIQKEKRNLRKAEQKSPFVYVMVGVAAGLLIGALIAGLAARNYYREENALLDAARNEALKSEVQKATSESYQNGYDDGIADGKTLGYKEAGKDNETVWKEQATYYVWLYQGMLMRAIDQENWEHIDALFGFSPEYFVNYWSVEWPKEKAEEQGASFVFPE